VVTPTNRPALSRSGPPELPRVDRRVGLDGAGDLADVGGWQMAIERAHQARGERAREAKGIADRVHRLADAQVAGSAERNGPQSRRDLGELHHREVVVGRHAHHFRRIGLARIELDLHGARALDHVEVGDDVT
jgi:hypothetical protein